MYEKQSLLFQVKQYAIKTFCQTPKVLTWNIKLPNCKFGNTNTFAFKWEMLHWEMLYVE